MLDDLERERQQEEAAQIGHAELVANFPGVNVDQRHGLTNILFPGETNTNCAIGICAVNGCARICLTQDFEESLAEELGAGGIEHEFVDMAGIECRQSRVLLTAAPCDTLVKCVRQAHFSQYSDAKPPSLLPPPPGFDTPRGPQRFTALHTASRHGEAEFVERLIAAKASLKAKTKRGDTALHLAVYGEDGSCLPASARHLECARKLVLADRTVMDERNAKGETALEWVTRKAASGRKGAQSWASHTAALRNATAAPGGSPATPTPAARKQPRGTDTESEMARKKQK